MKLIVRAFAFAVLLPVLATAQAQDSINGQWASPTVEADVQPAVSLSLTVSESKVTGSVILTGGLELSIEEGTLDASKVEFKTTQSVGDATVVSKWIGTVKTDEIAFSRAAENGQGTTEEIVVKRKPVAF
jgi:hypothetical protein